MYIRYVLTYLSVFSYQIIISFLGIAIFRVYRLSPRPKLFSQVGFNIMDRLFINIGLYKFISGYIFLNFQERVLTLFVLFAFKARGLLSLLCILGGTWITAIIYNNVFPSSIFLLYLSTILNSLQGDYSATFFHIKRTSQLE